MSVERFTNQYELAASLYERTPEELRRLDEGGAEPVQRWLAIAGGKAVGAVTAHLRPDDRLFLRFVGHDPSAFGPLTEAAAASLDRPVYTMVDAGDRAAVEALEDARFRIEVERENFRLHFERVLPLMKRAWVPTGFIIEPADTVDEDRFALDNTLRQDVPGTDGWRGDRKAFHDELSEAPPFDPAAYLVALDEENGEYVGLVRIWRNPDGPRFGLLGVVRHYRSTRIAAALLKQGLTGASRWGHRTLTVATSPSNRVIYPRMRRLGAETLGRHLQLVRR